MSKVYSTLGLGVLISGISGYMSSYGLIPYSLIYVLLIGCMIAELFYMFTRHSKFSREILSPANFYASTFAIGAAFGLVFSLDMSKKELLILKEIYTAAFIYTAAIFLALTIFSLMTVRRLKIFYGCIFTSLILSIVSFFIFNATLYSIIGLIVGSLYIVVDTQLMINKTESGIFEPYEDARSLFYNLAKIFIRIVVLLSKNEKNKKEN